eukprot:JZ553604.1.p2 GENE.JZ553604.1~~JZ553604.1.p2  ORF type:complete len:60 (-),score=1.16 JZ553604.1:25-204(-)
MIHKAYVINTVFGRVEPSAKDRFNFLEEVPLVADGTFKDRIESLVLLFPHPFLRLLLLH